MTTYQHSVILDTSKCTGCTTCTKHCPTEAIRIKDGVASINSDRCIDCGECIRHCPHHAKKANYSKFSTGDKGNWKFRMPDRRVYALFQGLVVRT